MSTNVQAGDARGVRGARGTEDRLGSGGDAMARGFAVAQRSDGAAATPKPAARPESVPASSLAKLLRAAGFVAGTRFDLLAEETTVGANVLEGRGAIEVATDRECQFTVEGVIPTGPIVRRLAAAVGAEITPESIKEQLGVLPGKENRDGSLPVRFRETIVLVNDTQLRVKQLNLLPGLAHDVADNTYSYKWIPKAPAPALRMYFSRTRTDKRDGTAQYHGQFADYEVADPGVLRILVQTATQDAGRAPDFEEDLVMTLTVAR